MLSTPAAVSESHWASSRRSSFVSSPGFACVVLVAAVWLCYWPATTYPFINYDDQDYVTENPHIQAGLSRQGIAWAFSSFYAGNWHPLTWLSHMLDVQCFGHGAAGPHTVNLVLHTANTLLLFFWLRRLTGAHWRSAVVAALFALHPLHVESVAWVAERKDVLSLFFALGAFWAYAEHLRQTAPGRRSGWYWSACLLYTCALMSKPMVVSFPFLLLLLDFWPGGRLRKGDGTWDRAAVMYAARDKVPFFLLSAGCCVVSLFAQRHAMQSLAALPFTARLENAFVSYARYLGKTIVPINLALPYPHPGEWPVGEVGLAALLVFAFSAAGILLARRWPYLFVGWFWFLGALVPVIGLVQVGGQSLADRYMYLPSIGLFVIGVWAFAQIGGVFRPWSRPIQALAAVTLALCGLLTFRQVGYWRDSETLFTHSAAVTTGNYVALSNVGGALFASGRIDEAAGFYERALDINPYYVDALNSLGAVLAAKNSDEAIEWFRRALAVQPDHPEALFNMGNALAKQGQNAQAVPYFEHALQIRPENFEARNNLGNVLLKLGRRQEAAAQYRLALAAAPQAAIIHKNLAGALADTGDFDGAIREFRQALRLSHTNEPAIHYSLGLALAVRGRWAEAINEYRETLRLGPPSPEAEYNLGYALREKGELDEAARHLETALRLRPEFPLAQYNLGCVLADQGRRTEAIQHLHAALTLQTNYPEAQTVLRRLEQLK